jgi:hypothetical protein
MAKKRKRTPALRPKRAWVPVTPDGVVQWHLLRNTRDSAAMALCGADVHWAARWSRLRREGWRIVRCRVE